MDKEEFTQKIHEMNKELGLEKAKIAMKLFLIDICKEMELKAKNKKK